MLSFRGIGKFLGCLVFIGGSFSAFGQTTVTNNLTVEQYVQNVLLGAGVTVSNIQFNAGPGTIVSESVGEFNAPVGNFGLTNGLILASGDAQLAAQANLGGGSSLGGSGTMGSDTDLQSITPNQIWDEAVLEFDFVPAGNLISFRYVFASEEYDEYVCGSVNDAFGFFLTGNNPAGGTYNATNIALIPDPANPGSFTSTAVSINTVNLGVEGFNGDPVNCDAIDPNWASYNVFYAGSNMTTNYEYDGNTVVLVAQAAVECGETYHIKLAIGDAGDNVWDSGVFLEAGSFASEAVDISVATVNGDTNVIEGCTNAQFIFTRPASQLVDTLVVDYQLTGTAVEGTDFNNMTNPVVFLPGEDIITLNLNPTDDGLDDGPETVIITAYTVNDCGDTLVSTDTLYILDAPEAIFSASTVDGCQPLDVTFTNTSKHSDNYQWTFGNGQSATVNNLNPQNQTYIVPGTAQLIVSFDGQCPDTASIAINTYVCGCTDPLATNYNPTATVDDGSCYYPYPTVIAPNVFTPDGNEENPFFELITTNAVNIEFTITNRWGITMYTASGINPVWDGKVNGNPASEGVYFYQYKVTGVTGDVLEGHGFVELIR
ncbi:MAG TPA: choice-of-anchor L domain-containing protein [Fluviicola sp.]|nr:choice-of-anchor L domain-containing protein [Fluviicola sp.]